jgi:hypothetical protein
VNATFGVVGRLRQSGADFYIPATGGVTISPKGPPCPISFDLGTIGINSASSPPVPSSAPSGPYYTPIQGLTAHVQLSWATLEQTPIGQSFHRPANGPMSPFLPPANCNVYKTAGYKCTQTLAWQGGITFLRTG